jgi:chaperonin GroES
MNIKVFGARMVLKPDKKEETTKSGILLPEKAQEETYTGTVIAVGNGMRLENGSHFPMEVQVGDRVIYSRIAGVPYEHEGENYLIINENHIVAVI